MSEEVQPLKGRVVFQTIDQYIESQPLAYQQDLQSLRALVKEVAPDAEERMSYQMPTFYLKGNLVHFALQKKHLGFYPAPSAIEAFRDELAGYKTSKGAIRFPLDQPLPWELIRAIVIFRVNENQ